MRLVMEPMLSMPMVMEASVCKRLQKTCKELRVFTVEAQELVWRLAPRDWIGKRKAAIAGVARRLGWDFSRTWNIAHGRARVIRAEEWIALNEAVSRLAASAAARQGELNEIKALERAALASPGNRVRPLVVDGDAAGKAGHRP